MKCKDPTHNKLSSGTVYKKYTDPVKVSDMEYTSISYT